MQSQDYLSTITRDMIFQILPKLTYKDYTALNCCAKIFSDIASQYSKIAWPTSTTLIKQLSRVKNVRHHVDRGIIATTQYEGYYMPPFNIFNFDRVHSIFNLLNGRTISKKSEAVFSHKSEINIEEYPIKTTENIYTYPYPYRYDLTKNIVYRDLFIKVTCPEKDELCFSIDREHIYKYLENKDHLIYVDCFRNIVVFNLNSNTSRLTIALKENEKIQKWQYDEKKDHLFFCSTIDKKVWINIYEIKTGELLNCFEEDLNFREFFLYLSHEQLLVKSVYFRNSVACAIYDLKSEKLFRTIPLKDPLSITQLSFKKNSLYITQDKLYDKKEPSNVNCIVSRIDFIKPGSRKSEIKQISICDVLDACTIL